MCTSNELTSYWKLAKGQANRLGGTLSNNQHSNLVDMAISYLVDVGCCGIRFARPCYPAVLLRIIILIYIHPDCNYNNNPSDRLTNDYGTRADNHIKVNEVHFIALEVRFITSYVI